MMDFTPKMAQRLTDYLETHYLTSGLGNKDGACSIAAINLAISGKLMDEIPNCMSQLIGKWIIRIQDAMPDAMRNSPTWKAMLPLAAGTGREREAERLAIIMDWMWSTVLPHLQPLADNCGFGSEWLAMTTDRTQAAAEAAAGAARAWAAAATADAAAEAWAATAAAAARAEAAAKAAEAAWAAAWAAKAEAWDAEAEAEAEAWDHFNPPALLKSLVEVGQ